MLRPSVSVTSRPYPLETDEVLRSDTELVGSRLLEPPRMDEVLTTTVAMQPVFLRDLLVNLSIPTERIDTSVGTITAQYTRNIIYSSLSIPTERVDTLLGVMTAQYTREVRYLRFELDTEHTNTTVSDLTAQYI